MSTIPPVNAWQRDSVPIDLDWPPTGERQITRYSQVVKDGEPCMSFALRFIGNKIKLVNGHKVNMGFIIEAETLEQAVAVFDVQFAAAEAKMNDQVLTEMRRQDLLKGLGGPLPPPDGRN